MDRGEIRKEIKRLNALLKQAPKPRGRKPRTTAVRITHDGSVEKVSTQEARKLAQKTDASHGRVVTIFVSRNRSIN